MDAIESLESAANCAESASTGIENDVVSIRNKTEPENLEYAERKLQEALDKVENAKENISD